MSQLILFSGIKEDLTDLPYTKADSTIGRVQHFALWRNNLVNENKENPFLCPAIFAEFLDFTYMEGSSKKYQVGKGTVRLHIIFETYKDEDMDVINLKQAVFVKMQLKQYGNVGVLKRRSETQDFDHTNLQDFIQDYSCDVFFDDGASKLPTIDATVSTINITTDVVDEVE